MTQDEVRGLPSSEIVGLLAELKPGLHDAADWLAAIIGQVPGLAKWVDVLAPRGV